MHPTSAGTPPPGPGDPPVRSWSLLVPWLIALLPWLILVNYLRLEWAANEQYGYGFVVPLLAIYLALLRWPSRPVAAPLAHPARLLFLAIPLAGIALPLLLLVEASPEWRLIGWYLALVAIGLTACLLLYRGGIPWLRHFTFPLLFILVAVPWPIALEWKVTGNLMQFDAATAVEILNWTGTPANQLGNVIALPTGLVGVDEACSGVRSLQTSLMIALFAGEWLGFDFLRRLVLLVGALALTYALNLVRALVLVTLSMAYGKAGILRWHDTAGLTILALTLLGLWGLSAWIARSQKAAPSSPRSTSNAAQLRPWPRHIMLAFGLWFLVAELATQFWFDYHESRDTTPDVKWTAHWPESARGYEPVEIPQEARFSFLYATDQSSAAKWQDLDGSSLWLGYFLQWKPGRETSILASTHRPDICLPASGKPLVADDGLATFTVDHLELPVRIYQFDDGGRPLFVFFCVWSNGHGMNAASEQAATAAPTSGFLRKLQRLLLPFTPESNLAYRLGAIARGQRNHGQQLLELGLWGSDTLADAKARFAPELEKIVTVAP